MLRLLSDAGYPVAPGAQILDFGCGLGALVSHLRALGFDAYGCDFPDELGDQPYLNAIEEPYRLPFEDSTFDVVVSDQVLEHVQDYRQAFTEIRRVLTP